MNTFSTFIQFSDDRFDGWVPDPRLVKSMNQRLLLGRDQAAGSHPSGEGPSDEGPSQGGQADSEKTSCEACAGVWALYWHRLWSEGAHSKETAPETTPETTLETTPETTRAQAHLAAYLQESCYWAALNVTGRFVSVQCTLADGFQIAIARLERILAGYKPDYGNSLTAYARTAFGNFLRDRLRQQKAIHICSDWGLLRKLSQTQLKESLRAAGFIQVSSFVLLWQCFKAVCVPDPNRSVRALAQPTDAQLSHLVSRYNQLRTRLSPAVPRLEVTTAETMLGQLVQAARAYLNPTVTSLNQLQSNESGHDLLSDFRGDEADQPMTQLLAAEAFAEQQARQRQIGAVLTDAIAGLDAHSQSLLRLYYQCTLTQNEIAAERQLKQYQVSRQLNRIRQQLLLSVADWCQQHLHIALDSPVLASVNEVIHDWLQHHYSVHNS